jgi:hypothetical protein
VRNTARSQQLLRAYRCALPLAHAAATFANAERA